MYLIRKEGHKEGTLTTLTKQAELCHDLHIQREISEVPDKSQAR